VFIQGGCQYDAMVREMQVRAMLVMPGVWPDVRTEKGMKMISMLEDDDDGDRWPSPRKELRELVLQT
jgi:hypothetical protein